MSAAVDDETVLIHDIIVFKDMFSHVEMTSFHLFLNSSDSFGQCLTLDEWFVFRQAREKWRIEHREELVASEYSHDIITRRYEKLAHTWITLTTGTTTELVVDATCFVFFRTEDSETSELDDTFAELDVGTSTSHIRGYRDRILLPCFCYDFGFTSILFGIQDFMFDAFFCEHI